MIDRKQTILKFFFIFFESPYSDAGGAMDRDRKPESAIANGGGSVLRNTGSRVIQKVSNNVARASLPTASVGNIKYPEPRIASCFIKVFDL